MFLTKPSQIMAPQTISSSLIAFSSSVPKTSVRVPMSQDKEESPESDLKPLQLNTCGHNNSRNITRMTFTPPPASFSQARNPKEAHKMASLFEPWSQAC
jgi:hypothetical protein